MKVRFSTLIAAFVQLVFCTLFLFFFVNNSLVRPTAPGIQYKEYFIGSLLLLMIYINALILYPRLYRRNQVIKYILFSMLCIAISLVVEFAWIYPDVIGNLRQAWPEKDAQKYYWGSTFFVFLRDAGLLSITFLLCDISWLHHKEEKLDKILVEKTGNIPAEDAGGNMVLLKTNSVLFCEQEENYTKIYCKNHQVFTRYGSLRKTLSLLGSESFLQINRNTIVLKNIITSYQDGELWISGEEKPFEVSASYQHLFPNPAETEQEPNKTANSRKGSKNEDGKTQQKESPKEKAIHQLISDNPGVSAVQLAAKSKISQSSVNRIIARLKQQGLIEHVGSNKTGGYRVVEN